MSLVTEALDRAEDVIDTVIDTVKDRLQSLPTDAKESATDARDDSKALAARATYLLRRQAAAWVGITDATLAAWTKRTDELQVESRKNAAKLVDDTKSRVTQAGELITQAGDGLDRAVGKLAAVAEDVKERSAGAYTSARRSDLGDVSDSAAKTLDTRYNEVVNTFNELADRGEKIITQLRHQRPVKISATPPTKTGTAQKTAPAAKKSPAAKKAPAKTAPAAKKAPAKKAPAQKAAAAAKATTRQATSTAKQTAASARATAKSTGQTAARGAKATAKTAASGTKATARNATAR